LPYIYRGGSGLIVKGLDETVLHMKVGDKWHVTFGGEYSFEKGKPSSPGKPRIPPGAIVEYDLELSEMPGTEEDFIADFE
jgi:FKBP-type peptidyl-prolyl cis-trans isomerase